MFDQRLLDPILDNGYELSIRKTEDGRYMVWPNGYVISSTGADLAECIVSVTTALMRSAGHGK